jgi:hypothetical protein
MWISSVIRVVVRLASDGDIQSGRWVRVRKRDNSSFWRNSRTSTLKDTLRKNQLTGNNRFIYGIYHYSGLHGEIADPIVRVNTKI